MTTEQINSRRQFIRYLAASPLAVLPAGFSWAYPERAVPDSLREVLNIFQLDRASQRTLSPEAYHFIVGAADDGATKLANRQAYENVQIRPRRLVDVSEIDTSIELFGQSFASPIMLAPVGDQQKIHPDGELATARAAKSHLMMCSMMTNASVAEIASVGGAYWFQLYPSTNREFMKKLMADAKAAGCRAIVLTIDGPARGNHEAARWFRLTRDKQAARQNVRLGNFEGYTGVKSIGDPALTWDDLAWFRDNTPLPLILKGVVTGEDATLCRQYGLDGIIVSNHGGRQEANGRGTLAVLPEIVTELNGRMPILIDGGIRRGSDVFKALALGANAVAVGRPYLWGLGAYGEQGVRKALSILQTELVRTMMYAGTPLLADINKDYVWIND
jgi:4-hydroxymandelate oxidase